jgi:hypothetical protein
MSATAQIAEKWEYQTEQAIIVPYIGGAVSDSFPEDFLVRLYFKMKHDGSLRRALPDATIQNLAGFVSYFCGKTILVCFEKSKDPDKINPVAGFVWLYDIHGNDKVKRASVGVVFWKEYWGNKVIYEMGKLTLRWMFEVLNLSVVLGTIAAWNRSSVRFGKALGFEVCGVVPMFFLKDDVSTDMVMVALRRGEFCG